MVGEVELRCTEALGCPVWSSEAGQPFRKLLPKVLPGLSFILLWDQSQHEAAIEGDVI